MSRFRLRAARSERGYALLMVVFLGAAMLIAATAAAPNLLTQGRREREEEMIWRGEQYVRAVKLYYRKNGRFPTSLDELVEKRTQVRYLRRRYEDPMNKEDGSWRLIYVGPGGQLIGSLTRLSAIQVPTVAGAAQPGKAPGTSPAPVTQLQPVTGTATPPTTGAQPQPLSTGPVIGGNIIGVASKVEKQSLKAYNGRTTYKEWEFIWDPARDAQVVAPGLPVVQPPGGPAPPAKSPTRP